MDLLVQPLSNDPTHGQLTCDNRVYDCALGRSGVTTDKREGDGATPLGQFALRQVLYRADRLSQPTTSLPATPIKPDDGWCDAPGDALYNQPVTHPYSASAERLWRDDNRYDLILVLGHNDDPVVSHAGSAIFLHVAAEDFRPTEGCIALQEKHVLDILMHCTPTSRIKIQCA